MLQAGELSSANPEDKEHNHEWQQVNRLVVGLAEVVVDWVYAPGEVIRTTGIRAGVRTSRNRHGRLFTNQMHTPQVWS